MTRLPNPDESRPKLGSAQLIRRLPAHGIHLLGCALLLMPCAARALDCPSIPEQARKDWEVEIRAAVGKIGAVKGAELETLARNTTRDLMGKLPQADKVYLEQMMYATFCSALRDDTALTESQKSARIKAYNLEVRKTLHAAQTPPGRDKDKTSAKDAAREELARIPLPYTPDAFVESAKKGDLATVKLFLAAGMDPNMKHREGDTALISAAAAGHIKIVEALLKAKANVNQRNERSETALGEVASAASRDRSMDIVRLLLDHGADTKAINDAFLSAAWAGHLDVLGMLVKGGADKNLGNKALLAASGHSSRSEADHNSVVRFLLELGADANAKDDDGTALTYAAATGRTSIVQTLLDAGADINAKCICTGYFLDEGWTALMVAVIRSSNEKAMADTVDILLARGADPNLASRQGRTALSIVLGEALRGSVNSVNVVRALLEKHADVNAKNNGGSTALMQATDKYGGVEVLHLLLEKHADMNAKGSDGSTALMWAASRNGGIEKLRLLLEKHADVNAKDNNQGTALIWAAADGNVEGIEALLDAGADLHAKNVKGKTALMRAIQEGQVEVVHALLRKGAKVNDEDAIGKTPLNYAEEDLEGKARTEMMRILKKAGAQ